MAARVTMTDLLLTLRGLTAAGSAEYTVNGSAYWTDDQLQAVMDRHVFAVNHEALTPVAKTGIGSIAYFDYQSARRFFEGSVGTSTRFTVQDATGATIGTAAYTADYPAGRVTFGTDTLGAGRYLTGYSYNLNACAADIWGQKAAHYVTAYDFSTDNHNLRRSQIIDNCLKMAREYAAGGAVVQVFVGRSDDAS